MPDKETKDYKEISANAIYENKLKLSSRELWNYYDFCIFFFFFVFVLGFGAFMIFADIADDIAAMMSAIFLLTAVVVCVIKKLIKERMLKFRSVETNMSPAQQCSYLR